MATAPTYSATQPAATTALQQPAAPRDSRALQALAGTLGAKFTQYESDRRIAELKWARNARQFLGIYDPEVDKAIDQNRSRAYPKLTRVKCVSMLSRLMNLLFQASDKNWGVEPSALPNLSQEDLQEVLNALPQDGQAPTDEQVETAILKFARKRAERLELEIEDQLQELGGSRAMNYVALCRKVLASGIQYGAGVLRGPFVDEQKQRKWQMANGQLTAREDTAYRPRFEFVSIWDYYPDMSAANVHCMDGQFLRRVMTRYQFVALKNRSDFISSQIDEVLRLHPSGNYTRKPHETELKSMGAQINVSQAGTGNKFECLVWDGYVSGAELRAAGATNVPENKLGDVVLAQVWLCGGLVIKAEVNPWVSLLKEGETIQQYHHFIFEEDESFLLGNGLPNIMRDSQMGLCAATRMALDNGSVQRVFEILTQLLDPDRIPQSIEHDMLIYRTDSDATTVNVPAVRAVELPMNIDKLQALATMFLNFADQETFVNAATGGDLQKGPSEPFRTAAGASMLKGDAALPFKDVVRNFDCFTESMIGSMVMFNQKFNPDPNVRGDFTPVAKGATTLIAKEVQGIQLDQLAQTLTDEEKRYLNPRELLRARLRVRDMDTRTIVYDDEKCEQIDQQLREQQQAEAAMAQKTAEANVRKLLSDVLKNIAQANKNAAGAEAAVANVILSALEKGLNPDMVASAAQPQGTPNGQPATGGEDKGSGPAGAGAPAQPGSGPSGLEVATGAAAAGPGSQFAAMPAG